jgi:hypothetical protein
MGKIFVSPAVITNEIDQSYLPAAVGAIGAAFIGKMPYGPAFVPYSVNTYTDAANVFGDLDPTFPMSYGIRAYMRNSSQATIIRVLGPTGRSVNGTPVTPGYTADSMWAVASTSGTQGFVHATLELSGVNTLTVTNLNNDLFDLRIGSGSNYLIAATCSFLPSSANYIKKILNSDPKQYYQNGYYLKSVYDYQTPMLGGGASTFFATTYAQTDFTKGYNSGSTPWITSQEFGGGLDWNLFRFHTLGHGNAENGRLKVSVGNVTMSPNPTVNPYGTFDVVVRLFSDTDKNPVVLESFPNCSMDPGSANYLPLRIGDRYYQYDALRNKIVPNGTFSNVSKYVRVEMGTGSIPQQALPWGFRGLAKPLLSVTLSGNISVNGVQDMPYVKDLLDKETQTEATSYVFWGVEFQLSGSVRSRLFPMPAMPAQDTDFSLKWVSGSTEGNMRYSPGTTSKKAPGTSLGYLTMDPGHAQFSVPFAFGFDGFDVRLADPTSNETQCIVPTQLGTQAFRQGIDCISDPDFIDINMLTIPGMYAPPIVNYAIQAVENRGDTFYVAEVSASTAAAAVNQMNNLGYTSNYASTYYPSVKIVDPTSRRIVTVPPSVVAAAAVSYTDRVSYPWYAPAGLNRGALNADTIGFTVVEAVDRLTQTERDMLYAARVNPIASFPAEGVAIWGQKTMQVAASALDRVNVRRLLIKAKKFIASTGKYLLFEPNNANTWTRFKQLVNPFLQDIQIKNGLSQFLVVMDETTNTPDLIDRNQMAGTIYLVPTRAAEALTVDFVVSRTGATFSQ